jgi:hypothetical protein
LVQESTDTYLWLSDTSEFFLHSKGFEQW